MRVGDEHERINGHDLSAGRQQAIALLSEADGLGRVVPAIGGASGRVQRDGANAIERDVSDVRSEAKRVILAIDPGNELSALVWFDTEAQRVLQKCKVPNDDALQLVSVTWPDIPRAQHLAIEMAESFGAKVWSQVFTTVLWTGRLVQAWGAGFTLVTRRQVKLAITGSPRAKDGQIRQCLIDRFGPGKEKAIGTKKQPGPLHGVSADVWSALAVAVTFADGAVQ